MKTNHKEIIMDEFLYKQEKELMQKHGITRREALEIIAEILKEDQNKPVMQVMKEIQGDRSYITTLVPPKHSDKDLLIMLLENLRDAFYSNRYERLCDIVMFLHRDECEAHTPYISRNTLNMCDLDILEQNYKMTQDELKYYKLIDFE